MSPLCIQVSGCESLRSFIEIISSFGTCVSVRELQGVEERNPESDKYIVLGKIRRFHDIVSSSTEVFPLIKHSTQTFYLETFGPELDNKLECRVVFIGDIVLRFSEHNLKTNDYVALLNPIVSSTPCGITLTISPSKPVPIMWYYSSESDDIEEDMPSTSGNTSTGTSPNKIHHLDSSEELSKKRRSSKNSKSSKERTQQSKRSALELLDSDSSAEDLFRKAHNSKHFLKKSKRSKVETSRSLASRRSNQEPESPRAQHSKKSKRVMDRSCKPLKSSGKVRPSSSKVHNLDSSSDDSSSLESVVHHPPKKLISAKLSHVDKPQSQCPAPELHDSDSSVVEVISISSNSDEPILNRQESRKSKRSKKDCEAHPQVDPASVNACLISSSGSYPNSTPKTQHGLASSSTLVNSNACSSNSDPRSVVDNLRSTYNSAFTPPIVKTSSADSMASQVSALQMPSPSIPLSFGTPTSSGMGRNIDGRQGLTPSQNLRHADSASSQVRSDQGNEETRSVCCCRKLVDNISLLIGCCTHNTECMRNKAIVQLLQLVSKSCTDKHCFCTGQNAISNREPGPSNASQATTSPCQGNIHSEACRSASSSRNVFVSQSLTTSVPLQEISSEANRSNSSDLYESNANEINRSGSVKTEPLTLKQEPVNIKEEVKIEFKVEPDIKTEVKTEMKVEEEQTEASASEPACEAPKLVKAGFSKAEELNRTQDTNEVQVSGQNITEKRSSAKQVKATRRRKKLFNPQNWDDDESYID